MKINEPSAAELAGISVTYIEDAVTYRGMCRERMLADVFGVGGGPLPRIPGERVVPLGAPVPDCWALQA